IWSAANVNSTRIIYACEDNFFIANINPNTMQVTSRVSMPVIAGSWTEAIWSHTDPDVFYSVYALNKLISFNVATMKQTVLHDFDLDFTGLVVGQLPLVPSDPSDGVPAGTPTNIWIGRMSMSANADVFGFTLEDTANYHPFGLIVWKRSTGQVLL